ASTRPSSSAMMAPAARRSPAVPRRSIRTWRPRSSTTWSVSRVVEPSETLTTCSMAGAYRSGRRGGRSVEVLAVPAEAGARIDGEHVAQVVPGAPRAWVLAVHAGHEAPRPSAQARLEVERAGAADATALEPAAHQPQVDGRVTRVGIVQLVV